MKMTSIAKTLAGSAAALAFLGGAAMADEDSLPVPPDATPPEAKIYMDAARAGARRAKTQKYISDLKGDYTLPNITHPYVVSLRALPPAQREAEARTCLSAKCFNTRSGGDGIETLQIRAAALEALRYQGISAKDAPHVEAFQNNFKPSPGYVDWEEQQFRKAVLAMRDAGAGDILAQIRENRKSGKTETLEQHALWHELLQMASDKIRAAFDLKPVPVILDAFPEDLSFASGFFQPLDLEDAPIFIRYNHFSMSSDFLTLMVAAHEAKHSVDHSLARMVTTGQIKRDDPRYAHAVAFLLNTQTYAQKDPEYTEQYVERTASHFERVFRDGLYYALAPHNQNSSPRP